MQSDSDAEPAAHSPLVAVEYAESRPLNFSCPLKVPSAQEHVVVPAVLSTKPEQVGPSCMLLKKTAAHKSPSACVLSLAAEHAVVIAVTYWSRTHGSSVQLCAATPGRNIPTVAYNLLNIDDSGCEFDGLGTGQ